MTPVELTEGAGVLVALFGLVVQEAGRRRSAARLRAREAESKAHDDAAENLASWEAFNASIVAERNRLLAEAREMQSAHRIEMQRIHDRHHEEIAAMREQWDTQAAAQRKTHEREIGTLTRDLAACRDEVSRLHAALYKLQNPGSGAG